MTQKENSLLIKIYTSQYEQQSDKFSLVLRSKNIYHEVAFEQGHWNIYVESDTAPAARQELVEYDLELKSTPHDIKMHHYKINKYYILAFAFLFVSFHFATFYFDRSMWLKQGNASADLILQGEIYRTITSLTLHADIKHLASNMLVGSIIAFSLIRLIGSGVGLFLIFLSGAVGNYINAAIYFTNHRSIGASTAVFSALGLLGAIQLFPQFRDKKVNRWIPLAGAIALLGIIGTSGERTDIWAHFFGLFSGGIIGVTSGAILSRWMIHSKVIQGSIFISTLSIIIMSWIYAL